MKYTQLNANVITQCHTSIDRGFNMGLLLFGFKQFQRLVKYLFFYMLLELLNIDSLITACLISSESYITILHALIMH